MLLWQVSPSPAQLGCHQPYINISPSVILMKRSELCPSLMGVMLSVLRCQSC